MLHAYACNIGVLQWCHVHGLNITHHACLAQIKQFLQTLNCWINGSCYEPPWSVHYM